VENTYEMSGTRERLTRTSFVSLESPLGNGVKMARAMQLANMVHRMTYSNTVNILLRIII